MYSELISESGCRINQNPGVGRREHIPPPPLPVISSDKSRPKFPGRGLSNPFVSFRQILRRIRSSIGLSTARSYEFHGNLKPEKLSKLTNSTKKLSHPPLEPKTGSTRVQSNNENTGIPSGSTNSLDTNCGDGLTTSSTTTITTCGSIPGSRYYIRNIGRKDKYKRSTKASSLQIRKRARSLSATKSQVASVSASTTTVTTILSDTGSTLYAPPRQVEREKSRGGGGGEHYPEKVPVCQKYVSCVYETNV